MNPYSLNHENANGFRAFFGCVSLALLDVSWL